jgi:hypothetical protein
LKGECCKIFQNISKGFKLTQYIFKYLTWIQYCIYSTFEISNDPHKVASKEIIINHLKTSFMARLVFNKKWKFVRKHDLLFTIKCRLHYHGCINNYIVELVIIVHKFDSCINYCWNGPCKIQCAMILTLGSEVSQP